MKDDDEHNYDDTEPDDEPDLEPAAGGDLGAAAQAAAEGAVRERELGEQAAVRAAGLETVVAAQKEVLTAFSILADQAIGAAYTRATTSPSSRDTAYWEGRKEGIQALLEAVIREMVKYGLA